MVDWEWRIPFLLSIVPIAVGAVHRRHNESSAPLAMLCAGIQARAEPSARG